MTAGKSLPYLTPSLILLVAMNMIPLAGVVLWGWPVFPVMVLFWLENVVIGVLNIPRILLSQGDGMHGVLVLGKWFTAAFFAVHYGIFTAVHGVFVFALFGVPLGGTVDSAQVWKVIGDYQLHWALAALILSHGFSFVTNYIGKGEYRTATIQQLMHAPYGRVVVLHLAILGGGFVLQLLGGPTWGLVLLVVLKIGLDVRAHRKEHSAERDEEIRMAGT